MSYNHLSFQKNIMYFIYLVISIYLYITEILLKFDRYKKTHPENLDVFSYSSAYLAKASFAWSANAVNAAASWTAKSANILRLMSISANFKPCINFE